MHCLARYSSFLFICGLILVIPGVSSRGDDQDQARALIVKAIKAHGGEEKLTKLPAETYKESGTFYAEGRRSRSMPTISVHFPQRAKIDIRKRLYRRSRR